MVMDDQDRKDMVAAQKEAYKAAIKDILADVGAWTVKGVFTALVGFLIYMVLTSQGWHK